METEKDITGTKTPFGKQEIREEIFSKKYNGIVNGIPFSDLPKDLQPTDIIDIQPNEAYYSENNSHEAYTELIVVRIRLETDEELQERVAEWEKRMEQRKEAEYKQFLKLKAKFESDEQKS